MRGASILVLCLLLCVPRVPAATYYFATNGSDAADGLSWETAKKDLQGFTQTQTVENTIYLAAGEYQMTNSWFAIPDNQKLIGDNRNSVLRGTGTNPVVYIVGKTNVWIEGLTITGGNNEYAPVQSRSGGGISAGSANGGSIVPSQFVTNCLIVSNSAGLDGGGARMITLSNCELSYNVASRGGGAYSIAGTNLLIRNNVATNVNGGGVFGGNGRQWTVANNAVLSAGGIGGGVNTVTVFDSAIVSNRTSSQGGGAASIYGTNNVVSFNTSKTYGGISSGSLSNSVIAFNSATNTQGGAGAFDSVNCVIASNTANTFAGGAGGGNHYGSLFIGNVAGTYAGGASGGKYYSCVFVSNSAATSVAGLDIPNANSLGFNCNVLGHTNNLPAVRLVNGGSLANSIVFGNASNVVALAGTPPVVNTNNYFDDPQFVSDTYRLPPGSPCIDAGNNTYAGGDLDFYGRPRVLNGTVDIGAAEFDPELDVPDSGRRSFFWSLLF